MSDDGEAIEKFLSGLEKSQSSAAGQRSGFSNGKSQNTNERGRRKEKPQLSAVDKVLPDVLSRLGLDRRLKEHSLMQMWLSIAPKPIAERSRPLFIDSQHNLVVTVSDASVAQEISLMKNQLIPHLSRVAKTLALPFAGIRIDLKHYHQPKELEPAPAEEPLPMPSEKDLYDQHLTKYDNGLIQDLSNKLAEEKTPPEIAAKVLKTFEHQLRLAQWRKLNGYPICRNCSNPVFRLHEKGANKLCFNCMIQSE
ncbi:MAG: DUF721 domain-containing protein [Candidatus Obscuribacterales bacterium]|jgi:hypothetical protein|nr:DUF721 domain-containing protein [Candidatus Obscuribacterales bacterium]